MRVDLFIFLVVGGWARRRRRRRRRNRRRWRRRVSIKWSESFIRPRTIAIARNRNTPRETESSGRIRICSVIPEWFKLLDQAMGIVRSGNKQEGEFRVLVQWGKEGRLGGAGRVKMFYLSNGGPDPRNVQFQDTKCVRGVDIHPPTVFVYNEIERHSGWPTRRNH